MKTTSHFSKQTTVGMAQHAIPAWPEAALWMLFLGSFFFLVYGTCNWITSLRVDVGTFYFGWETWIPFVPFMIIPYMSIDLFFAGSTFLCRTREELHTLAARVVFAICLSAICFLLFPLKFGFMRPEVTGWLGNLFAPLNTFDRPFNLAPSLHISLRSILWGVYGKRAKGRCRSALKVWFIFIGVSTLLVYQHHVVDLLGGYVVALLSFYFMPEFGASNQRFSLTKNVKVSLAYTSAAVVTALIAVALPKWNWIFLWASLALGLLAGAYLGLGPGIFQKTNGSIPLQTKLLLAPYFLGSRLSFWFYTRAKPTFGQVTENVFIGRKLSERETPELLAKGITAVLDLTAEYPETAALRQLIYKNVPILDLTTPTTSHLSEATAFIREQSKSGKVYVHCALGYSRSALVVAAYLLAEGIAHTESEALALVRRARPEMVLPKSSQTALTRCGMGREFTVIQQPVYNEHIQ